ncbi:MAG TPA: LamG-like jellyroll fold domain-containing protein, partial [Bacteroidota bacterium]|nr:LamG-like jellyroll fold domain-containing protein [Bacteroidota bacterium]
DASLSRYKGTLNSDHATIWQTGTPARFLRFDGVNDTCSFGNPPIPFTDCMIELWLRPTGANGTSLFIMSKISGTTGFEIIRNSTNTLRLDIGDGVNTISLYSDGTLLQNTWGHVAYVIRRTGGNGIIFLNGSQSGAGLSLSAIGSINNTASLELAKTGSIFSQVDIGAFRIYDFGSGQMPVNIAQVIKNHFEFERGFYGV